MKIYHLSAILFFLSFICLNANGQKDIEINSKYVSMSKGEQPAYYVEIPEANYESTVKNWKKVIRQNTKNKVQEEEHEIVIHATQIIEIYPDPFNLYSAIIKGDSSLKLIAVFEIDSTFFDFSKSDKSVKNEKVNSQIQHFLRNFATEQYMYAVEDEFEAEENTLNKMTKELESMGKQNENLLKDISENEQNIKNSEDAISSYDMDNERKQSEINAKKEAIAGINSDPELLDQAKGQLKALEKEKNGIEKDLEKEQKNIIKYQANIDALNLDVENNLEKQQIKKDEISRQELVVNGLRTKLHGIK